MIYCEYNKFVKSVYCSHTLSDIYTNSKSIIPEIFEKHLSIQISSILFPCFHIWSDFTKCYNEFDASKKRYQKNKVSINFVDKCKTGLNPIQDGGGAGGKKAPLYQFFPCNFYKLMN